MAARPPWVTAESRPVLFARAVEHLIAAKIMLPGASTVWRLVGAAREHANERDWALLAAGLTEEQRARLEALLDARRRATRIGARAAAPRAGRADRGRSDRRLAASRRAARARRWPRRS